ncbi:lysophospholipid acyltransferase family protein [Alphaproteobacteria bacterium]|nr:lysophospholipid acyltransferase family protein [Alphaproteobacteria bacterium]
MTIKKRLVKNFFIQNFLGLLAALYIYINKITSSIKYANQSIPEHYWKHNEPFILAFWHSQLMMIAFSWKAKTKINILASGHSDGRFGAIIGKYFNLNNIPTSKKNNNIALRPIFKLLKNKKYVGITPDGPRGPKEKVSEGIIKIAKVSKTPIIALGYASSKNFKLKSWDSFLISLPFSKCSFVWSEPLEVPADLKDNQVYSYQKLLEDKINKCIQQAKENCQ